jgi:hypothetical protein
MGDVVASCPRPSRMRAMSMIRSAAIALAGGMAIASGVASAPRQVALVEDVSGHPAGAGFMDYLEPGKIIRLGPRDMIVLGYLRSCVRETITGGIVTIGTDQSEVQSGKLERMSVPCDGGQMLRAADQAGQSAGMVFRGVPRAPNPQFTLFGSSPMLELQAAGTVVIERMDHAGERHVLDIAKGELMHGAFYDFAQRGKALAPGGTYRASFGGQELVFKIDPDAKPGRTPIVGRLLRFASPN